MSSRAKRGICFFDLSHLPWERARSEPEDAREHRPMQEESSWQSTPECSTREPALTLGPPKCINGEGCIEGEGRNQPGPVPAENDRCAQEMGNDIDGHGCFEHKKEPQGAGRCWAPCREGSSDKSEERHDEQCGENCRIRQPALESGERLRRKDLDLRQEPREHHRLLSVVHGEEDRYEPHHDRSRQTVPPLTR
jgi:hypothetical protein